MLIELTLFIFYIRLCLKIKYIIRQKYNTLNILNALIKQIIII